MRLHQIIPEAIVSQPHHLGTFLTARIKQLQAILATANQARDTIQRLERSGEGEYLLRYALGHANDGDRPSLPSAYAVDLDRHYKIEDLIHNLDAIVRHGPDRFQQYVMGTLGYTQPLHEETLAVLRLVPHVEAGFRDYGHDPDQPNDDPEYRDARQMADAYAEIARVLPLLNAIYARLRGLFADRAKRSEHMFDPDKYRPDHDAIETLFHATAYADAIARDGFAAQKPEERRGLGNFGNQDLISFTHSLKIAHDIMRGLREIWMIVHGQLTRRMITGWIRAEGMDLASVERHFMTDREPKDSLNNVIGLYRAYVALSNLRADPTFVSPTELIPLMQRITIKEIGIIAASVRVGDAESYHSAEREFRVDPSHVVGRIKRVA